MTLPSFQGWLATLRPHAALLSFLLLAGHGWAQTADPIFAGYRFAPDVAGSRPAGVGGAFTAIADGGKSAYVNPAGLVLIPARELELSSGDRWGSASASFFRVLHVAAYAAHTGDQDLGDQDGAEPSLEASRWEAGLGLGVSPMKKLRLGVAVAWSHLAMDGLRRQGDADEATTVTADDTHPRLTAGLLLTLVGAETRTFPTLRLGVSYQPGFDWTAQVADGNTGEPAAPKAIRRPSIVTAGLAWRTADRWSFSAQGDFIRYDEVVDAMRRNVGPAADPFRLPDTIEPRLGAEFAAPLFCGCGVMKARAGLHYRSPGTLQYEGPDPSTAAAFASGKWRTVASLGVSFLTEHFGNALRLDLDSKDLFEGPEISFGIAWRF